MAEAAENPFAELVAELADGQRRSLLRAEGWDDFVARLATVIARLDPLRRQALVMLLFALVDRQLNPDEARAWLEGHDIDSDDGLREMVGWLRQFRPSEDELLPGDVPDDEDGARS
jgi:hypothetical protein